MKKDRRLCIGTGWYADKKGHSNPRRALRTLQADWFSKYWIPYIERYIEPDRYFMYLSNCEISCRFKNGEHEKFEIVWGFDDASQLDHRHDFHCGLMMGAQWALCNWMDFLYIEQDCLVKGLDKAIAWAKDKKLVYGYGDMCSYSRNWAAQALIWVRNDFIPEFIARLNLERVHEGTGLPVPEIIFHDIFKDVFDAWPFGYDRKRPADFDLSKDVFYVQQVSDDELNILMKG